MIFRNGKELIGFNIFRKVDYTLENTIAVEPLEQGAFSNDSKQNKGYDVVLTAVKDAGSNDRDALMQTINLLDNLTNSPILVDLKTPYKIYLNVALQKWHYDITIDTLGIHADLYFKQIRLTDVEYSSVKFKRKQNAPNQSRGKVQPNGPQPANTSAITGLVNGSKDVISNIKNYFGG